VLGFNKVYGLKSQPTKTGDHRVTFTAVMKGRVDVGYAGPPFGLKELSAGKIRIVGRGRELLSVPGQTESTIITNTGKLAKDRSVIERFVKAYAEALDYMYASPEALKHYRDFLGNDEAFARTAMAEFYPRDSLDPYRIEGLDGVMADAIGYLFKRPLSKQQLAELFQVPAKK
jgi:NitT/TauT family transport system substrate-binding protein